MSYHYSSQWKDLEVSATARWSLEGLVELKRDKHTCCRVAYRRTIGPKTRSDGEDVEDLDSPVTTITAIVKFTRPNLELQSRTEFTPSLWRSFTVAH